jgi:hypothetical protein
MLHNCQKLWVEINVCVNVTQLSKAVSTNKCLCKCYTTTVEAVSRSKCLCKCCRTVESCELWVEINVCVNAAELSKAVSRNKCLCKCYTTVETCE